MAEKTESRTVTEAKEKAQKALFDLITDSVAVVQRNGHALSSQTTQTKNLAFAYRLISGGAQPGSVEVSSK